MTARISGRPQVVTGGRYWGRLNRGWVDATPEQIEASAEYDRKRKALQKAVVPLAICPNCVTQIADGKRKL